MNNSNLPLVSIVTPAYNRADYLEEVILSVLNQDYPNIEYIVLDDGSKDHTHSVLEKYTGRITWESHANIGETRTNNKGWQMSHGEIIATVNSDDPLLPGAVSAAVEFMLAHPDLLVAYPDWNLIGPKGELIKNMRTPEHDYYYMLRRHYCYIGPGAFIRRKAFSLTEMRDPAFRYVGDFEYWLRLGLFGPFGRIPRTLATFRYHPGSASVSQMSTLMAEEHIRLMDKLYHLPDLPPKAVQLKSEAYASAYYIAGVSMGAEPTLEKRGYYRKALTLSPLSQATHYPGRLLVMLPTFLGLSFRHIKAEEVRWINPKSWIKFLSKKP